MSLFLDASVIIPLYVVEPASLRCRALVDAASTPLVVSAYVAGEVASALSRLVRMKLRGLDDADARLADFDHWLASAVHRVDQQSGDVSAAATLVRRFELACPMRCTSSHVGGST